MICKCRICESSVTLWIKEITLKEKKKKHRLTNVKIQTRALAQWIWNIPRRIRMYKNYFIVQWTEYSATSKKEIFSVIKSVRPFRISLIIFFVLVTSTWPKQVRLWQFLHTLCPLRRWCVVSNLFLLDSINFDRYRAHTLWHSLLQKKLSPGKKMAFLKVRNGDGATLMYWPEDSRCETPWRDGRSSRNISSSNRVSIDNATLLGKYTRKLKLIFFKATK